MGYSTQSIPFFTDDIKIDPHTATHAPHLSGPITIKQFSNGGPCSLVQVESGTMSDRDYIVTLPNGDFIQGPER